MGASGSKPREIISDYIPSLLISFSKLEEFKSLFKSEKRQKPLSDFFSSLIENDKDLNTKVEEFKKMISKDKKKMPELIEYILNTLHYELNEPPKNVYTIVKKKNNDDDLSYDDFINIYRKDNDSIIQKLFFGVEEIVKVCSKCQLVKKNYEIFKMEKYKIPKEKEIDIRDLIGQKDLGVLDFIECKKCKKKKYKTTSTIINYPGIFIIFFDREGNNNSNNLIYYQNLTIKDNSYSLTCFIANSDENGKVDKDNNVFYLEDKKWKIYKIKDKETKNLIDIKKIFINPLVVFYLKDKIIFENFYENITLLLKDKENISEQVNAHLLPDIEYEKYYLVNKNWYNKILKIFEPYDKYVDDNFIIESIDNVTNPLKNMVKHYQRFLERKKIIGDRNLSKVDFNENEISKIKYPKDFMLIKENILKLILEKNDIPIDKYDNYLYYVKFGENYAFIKKNENEENEPIFVCSLNEYYFEVFL